MVVLPVLAERALFFGIRHAREHIFKALKVRAGKAIVIENSLKGPHTPDNATQFFSFKKKCIKLLMV